MLCVIVKNQNILKSRKLKDYGINFKVYIYETMFSNCLKCRKNTESKNPEVVKTKNERIILLSKCAVCNRKKLKLLK